jgi:hypothetical protein
MPAVKIGRLATAAWLQSKGIGNVIVPKGIKQVSVSSLVDSRNKEMTLNFYMRNKFQFLDKNSYSAEDKTRLMYFDLMTFRQ